MSDIPNIKGKSNWETQKDHDTINSFIEAVNKHTEDILEHKQALPQNNISIDLVFTKANKVGATVTLDFVNYTEKTSGELNNENYHKKFNHYLTQEHTNHYCHNLNISAATSSFKTYLYEFKNKKG